MESKKLDKVKIKIAENWRWLFWLLGAVVILALWLVTTKICIYPLLYPFSRKLFFLYCVITLLFLGFSLGLAVYLLKKERIRLEKVFLVCCLLAGMVYMMMLPAFTAPDEIAHYTAAYKWSNYLMFQEAVDEEGNLYMRAEDVEQVSRAQVHLPTKENYRNIASSLFDTCHDSEMVSFHYQQVTTGPVSYIPQTLGITLGRLLNLGWAMTIFLGRLMNLLFFAVCVYYAIKIMPFGKLILFSVSMLPMTLELISSLSYDVMPLALSLLFTAVCFHYIYVAEKIGRKEICVLAVLLALLAPCKTVYFLLAGLCLLIPREKFGTKKFFWCSAAIVLGVALFALILNNMVVLSGFVNDEGNYITWAGEPGYTWGILLSNPLKTVGIFVNTFRALAEYYWNTMIGMSLSWQNVEIGNGYVTAFTVILLASVLMKDGESQILKLAQKAWCGFLCVCVVILVCLSMLLGWTPISYNYIAGVQGRYFLPILPLALLLLRTKRIVIRQSLDKWLILATVVLNVFAVQKIAEVALVAFA